MMVFFRVLFATVLALGLGVVTAHAADAIRIDINKAGLNPLPIALPDFVALGAGGVPQPPGETGRNLVSVVSGDLARSGLLKPLDQNGFLQTPVSLWKEGPRYRDWQVLGSEALVSGAVSMEGGNLTVNFFLYDVPKGALIGKGMRFTAKAADWRHVAHRVADEIYTRLTGEKPYFTSRISFIAQQGKKKWLAIMDQDGANMVSLTKGQHIVLTPRFSPDGENLFYLSYETGEPRIFRWELYNGRRTQQGDYPGLNSTPGWSPDGSLMALTLSKDGNSEIYVKDLRSGALRRLTDNNAIDTSPSWAPDGKRIVFNSDRGGSPQLYVMNADGGNQHRISFEGEYNAAPAWSPRGDLITYVSAAGGKFRIAVTDPEGRRVRYLTDSWMDESPVWSPNGRVILFSRQEGDHTRLFTVDLTGYNNIPVPMSEAGVDASYPSWSPLIR